MKAADIADEDFLGIVAAINWQEDRWAMTWDMVDLLGFPEKIIRAKARSLIRRGLMDGCPCGCRGDFDVMPYRSLYDPV